MVIFNRLLCEKLRGDVMQLKPTNTNLSGSIQKQQQAQFQQLSSGKRINSAKDDAAGLSISTRLNTQSRSDTAAMSNIMSGISRVDVEEGALAQVSEGLMRIRELAVRAENGLLSGADKQAIESEIAQNYEQISDTLSDTQFNGAAVFSQGEMAFQIGAKAESRFQFETVDLQAQLQTAQGLPEGLYGKDALSNIDAALEAITSRRSTLGGVSNRLDSQFDQLQQQDINTQRANSVIEDADFAKVASEKAKTDIQQQVLISLQGQANVNSQSVLRLLKNE